MKIDFKRISNPHTLYFIGIFTITIIVVQLLYPSNYLLPFINVDGVAVGGWNKIDVINHLDSFYASKKVSIRFGDSDKVYLSPMLTDIGLSVSNTERVNGFDYPWYLRIIPTSILWAHFVIPSAPADYNHDEKTLASYMSANLGKNCQIDAVEPGFSIVIGKVVISPSQEGISCQKDTVKQALLLFRPTLNSDFVRIEATKISPKIDNGAVSRLYGQLNKIVGDGILLKSDYSSVTIPPTEIFKWLDLGMDNGVLKYSINETRASSYLYKTYLSLLTSDDKSIIASSTTGDTVQVNITNSELIADATIANVESYLEGNGDFVKVVDRQKSIDNLDLNTIEIDANLSQVIKQYAESYDGQYGVSFMELSTYGAKASYNDKTKFIAASTYKLYVAYSTLRRVEDGLWGWNDQVVGGQNLLTCFDNMIVNSNNACAEALLFKIGKQNVTNEAKAIGCSDTAFNYSSIETTSADLALFLAKLQTGNILDKQASRDVLLNAMRQNVYRLGIPTGLGGIDVADKVGFLWALLHDAAIVYSPRGTYVLVIMTNNSSWSTIADLAKHIEQYLTN